MAVDELSQDATPAPLSLDLNATPLDMTTEDAFEPISPKRSPAELPHLNENTDGPDDDLINLLENSLAFEDLSAALKQEKNSPMSTMPAKDPAEAQALVEQRRARQKDIEVHHADAVQRSHECLDQLLTTWRHIESEVENLRDEEFQLTKEVKNLRQNREDLLTEIKNLEEQENEKTSLLKSQKDQEAENDRQLNEQTAEIQKTVMIERHTQT
eukprot:gnl/MRDRNA2_/MRDRNA2_109522_c0_seq1.p1 gnl/MRDRNA2_/MRDRNA2_109522_c0~~gnl/MRDRNA2_/MRDRNA2_109522_c0_seq1.p1  ORF type:complete len:213 (-),score=60.75 gnl/MRDRNA2_/MRDRNA2_109522_c0_seq1:10-648(-)